MLTRHTPIGLPAPRTACGCTCATTAAPSTRACPSSACPAWRAMRPILPRWRRLWPQEQPAGNAASSRSIIAAAANPITIQTGGTTTSESKARIFSRNWRLSKFTRPSLSVRHAAACTYMTLAAARPALARAAVLNDVGPVIELQGLTRIRQYLRHSAAPNSLSDAVDYVRKAMSAQFTALSDSDFERYARASFQKPDGGFGATFDPNLVKPLETLRLDEPLPQSWGLFEALAKVPLLIIRGSNSDVLSQETFVEMARRHRNCAAYVVEGKAIRRCSPMTRRSRGSPTSSPELIRLEQGSRGAWRLAIRPDVGHMCIVRRCGREAEGGGLLNRYRVVKHLSRVRIPPSPPCWLNKLLFGRSPSCSASLARRNFVRSKMRFESPGQPTNFRRSRAHPQLARRCMAAFGRQLERVSPVALPGVDPFKQADRRSKY